MNIEQLRSCLLYEGKDSQGRYYFKVKKAIYNFKAGDTVRAVYRGGKTVLEKVKE